MPQPATILRRAAAALVLFAAATGAGPALAQSAAEAEGIRSAISGQFEAFDAEDFDEAFGFASPNIRGLFRSPENFGRMVRKGYPMVLHPGAYVFSTLQPEGGRLRQSVVITDLSGATHVADYYMIEVDGEWRIDGVQIRPLAAAGA